jgi:hypothetical protein
LLTPIAGCLSKSSTFSPSMRVIGAAPRSKAACLVPLVKLPVVWY